MKTNKLFIAIMIAFAGFVSAQQQGDYSKEPGYFDFGDITLLKSGEMSTEVYLEEPLLKMISQMGKSEEEGFGQLVENLKLVKVNEFEVNLENMGKLDDAFSSIDKTLQSKKWQRIIKTKQNNTLANVYVKPGSGNSFDGMVVTALDNKGKVTLVNIVGKIDLASIGKLSSHFHFPGMGKMKEGEKMKEKEDK